MFFRFLSIALFLFSLSMQAGSAAQLVTEFKPDDQYSLTVSINDRSVCELSSTPGNLIPTDCSFEITDGSKLLVVGEITRSGNTYEINEFHELVDVTEFTFPLFQTEAAFDERLDNFADLYQSLLNKHRDKLKIYLQDEHGYEGSDEDLATYFSPLVSRSKQSAEDLDKAFNDAEQRLGLPIPNEVREMMSFEFEIGYCELELLKPNEWYTFFDALLGNNGWDRDSLVERYGDEYIDIFMNGIALFGSQHSLCSIVWHSDSDVVSQGGVYITQNDHTLGEFEFWQIDTQSLPLSSVVMTSIYRDVLNRIVDEFTVAGVLGDIETHSWGALANQYLKVDSGNPIETIVLTPYEVSPDPTVHIHTSVVEAVIH